MIKTSKKVILGYKNKEINSNVDVVFLSKKFKNLKKNKSCVFPKSAQKLVFDEESYDHAFLSIIKQI